MSDLSRLDRALQLQPRFSPPWWLRNPHLQTIWANVWRRQETNATLAGSAGQRLVETEDGDRLQVYWNRGAASRNDPAPEPPPVLVVLHGLTGCADADNVRAVAWKGLRAGFDVVRVDLRNSLAAHPARGIGHAGRSEDLRAVVDHVRHEAPGARIGVIGFSLGGNIALKAAGEYGDSPPPELALVVAISTPIDLDRACRDIDRRSNAHFRRYFLTRLAFGYRARRRRHPDRLPGLDLAAIRTIRAWDNAVVAPLCGFRNAEHYYEECSALRVLPQATVPMLLLQARDDPFIPFSSFRDARLRDHPTLRLLAPPRGGHVGFLAATNGHATADRDAYWAENRAIAACAAVVGDAEGG